MQLGRSADRWRRATSLQLLPVLLFGLASLAVIVLLTRLRPEGAGVVVALWAVLVALPALSWAVATRLHARAIGRFESHLRALREQGRIGRLPETGSGPLARLASIVNRALDQAQQRATLLAEQNAELFATSKVIAYQKSRVAAVLESLPEATLLFDESGVVRYANGRLEDILGVPVKEVVGSAGGQWCPLPKLRSFLELYGPESACAPGGRSLEFQPEPERERWLVAEAYPLRPDAARGSARTDPSREHVGTLVALRDVSAEVRVRRAQAEFVSQIAEELRSPLQALGETSELLRDEKGGESELQSQACEVIRDEVERLSGLVGALLALARLESDGARLERRRVELAPFLRETFEGCTRGQRAHRLSLDVPEDLQDVAIDPDLLRVALRNLLANALAYTPAGGTVGLSAEETSDELIVCVRDSGAGIHPADVERIFEKFYRSSQTGQGRNEGHGLGLPLVRQIVALHGGRVDVDSAPEQGSRFSIHLPRNAIRPEPERG